MTDTTQTPPQPPAPSADNPRRRFFRRAAITTLLATLAMAREGERSRQSADAASGDEHRSAMVLACARQRRFGVLVGLRIEL